MKTRNQRQREYRRKNNNIMTKVYEKTRSGFLMRCYRNMKSRISGIQSRKHHLYIGKFLLKKADFYEWANKDTKFFILFKEWEASGYNRKLTPSVDRIDSKKGYHTTNMEWVTHSENSRRGGLARGYGPNSYESE